MSEYLHHVTDNYDAMSDLMKYGLIGTSISEVVTNIYTSSQLTLTWWKVLTDIDRYHPNRFMDDQLFIVMCLMLSVINSIGMYN